MRRSSSAISALFLSFGSNLALFVRSVLRSRTVLVAENLFLRKQIAFYCEHQRLTAFSSTIVDSIFSAELDQELSQGSATTIPDVRTPASGRAFPGCAQMSPSAGWSSWSAAITSLTEFDNNAARKSRHGWYWGRSHVTPTQIP
jgi:hypothetical protein